MKRIDFFKRNYAGIKNCKVKYALPFFLMLCSFCCAAEINIPVNGAEISGTLSVPEKIKTDTLCIIVPGSGPTDRNCNNSMGLNTNAYKLLAEEIAKSGIAVFRYDKRGIGKSKKQNIKEEDLVFEINSDDLKIIISHLRKTNGYKKIFLAGHSEGSLVSILCAQKEKIDGLISISGSGKNAGDLIIEQIEKNKANPKSLKEQTAEIVKKLQQGEQEDDIPFLLENLFRKSVQPYLISWFKYNPQTELSKLNIPCLIIHGKKDSQVSAENAKLLASAKNGAELHMIENMTHTLKEINKTNEESKTYMDPSYPISKELIKIITSFIKKN